MKNIAIQKSYQVGGISISVSTSSSWYFFLARLPSDCFLASMAAPIALLPPDTIAPYGSILGPRLGWLLEGTKLCASPNEPLLVVIVRNSLVSRKVGSAYVMMMVQMIVVETCHALGMPLQAQTSCGGACHYNDDCCGDMLCWSQTPISFYCDCVYDFDMGYIC